MFSDITVSRNPGTSTSYDSFQLRINDVYDPDPVILTGGVPGFNQYCQFFERYRVLSASVTWVVANRSTLPLVCFINFSDAGTAPASFAGAVELASNPSSTRPVTIAASGSSPSIRKIKRTVTMSSLVGPFIEYMANEDYAANAGNSPGNPVNAIFATFITYSTASWSAAVNSNLHIRFHVEFFQRRQLVS